MLLPFRAPLFPRLPRCNLSRCMSYSRAIKPPTPCATWVVWWLESSFRRHPSQIAAENPNPKHAASRTKAKSKHLFGNQSYRLLERAAATLRCHRTALRIILLIASGSLSGSLGYQVSVHRAMAYCSAEHGWTFCFPFG